MDTLRKGSSGYKVELLQRLLNLAARREGAVCLKGGPAEAFGAARLREDGIFGPLTEKQVRAFQTVKRLSVDGVAGTDTWRALGLAYEVDHRQVRLLGQPTGTSCWSAAASMIKGNMSVGPGGALLDPGGGLAGTDGNADAFAQSLGWRHLNYSPVLLELITIMKRTPIWISAGGANWAHAVALSGIWSDGNSSGATAEGTMVRIHDPWPVNKGRVYGSFADPLSMYDASGRVMVPASLMDVLVPN